MATITISRGIFSGGQSLAESVARKMGYRCLNREVPTRTAQEYGLPEEKLSEAIINPPGRFEPVNSERRKYLACLRAELIKEVRDSSLVYHGHAGHFLLRGVPHVLRVRVVVDTESRVKALTEHHNLSRRDALRLIKELDERRARWTQLLYHANWRDPSLYDLVINMNQMRLPDASDLVCHAALVTSGISGKSRLTRRGY